MCGVCVVVNVCGMILYLYYVYGMCVCGICDDMVYACRMQAYVWGVLDAGACVWCVYMLSVCMCVYISVCAVCVDYSFLHGSHVSCMVCYLGLQQT